MIKKSNEQHIFTKLVPLNQDQYNAALYIAMKKEKNKERYYVGGEDFVKFVQDIY